MAPGERVIDQSRELGVMSRSARTPSPAVDQANAELKALQFKAVTDYNRLRDGVARLGTAVDTVKFRQQLGTYGQSLRNLGLEFRKKVAQHPDRDAISTQKLVRDFQTLLVGSEKLMAVAREKEASRLPNAPGATALPTARPREAAEAEAAAEQQQRQALLAREAQLQFNEVLIEERDAAVQQINSQIGEVHQIFQDLAVLVSDQGAQLDDIEANIGRTVEHTREANTQLVKAERSQRRARSSWLCLLGAGVVVFISLILILSA